MSVKKYLASFELEICKKLQITPKMYLLGRKIALEDEAKKAAEKAAAEKTETEKKKGAENAE